MKSWIISLSCSKWWPSAYSVPSASNVIRRSASADAWIWWCVSWGVVIGGWVSGDGQVQQMGIAETVREGSEVVVAVRARSKHTGVWRLPHCSCKEPVAAVSCSCHCCTCNQHATRNTCTYLCNVEYVPQLSKVWWDELAPADVEGGIILPEGLGEAQGCEEGADCGHHALQLAATGVTAVLL